ncbi:MAG TPA: metallophosphoesterase [Polyangia bacterium]|jgi:predicted MPP superfamily phosphohydrolase|nr:metallophosphoesterase [Polyangia bacterium]
MGRLGSLVLFIAILIGVIGGLHYYLWARLVRDTRLPAPWNTIALGVLLALGAAIPTAMFVGRLYPALRRFLVWPAYTWIGVMFLLFITLLGGDILRALRWSGSKLVGSGDVVDAGRRTLVARILGARFLGAWALGLSGGLALLGMRSALGPVEVRRVRVQLSRLPRERHGTRIVQLTDMHVGPTRGRAFVEEIVRRTNELSADIVAITGDLVDGSVKDLRDAVAPLANLRARFGVFFVTGNHEYFSGAEDWSQELKRIGLRVLHNERVSIGEGSAAFDLAGVDDYSAQRYGGVSHSQALARAVAGRDPQRELILLAHQPRSIVLGEPLGVGLQLSGHTHGGQMWPFNYLVRLQQPFVAGLFQHGRSQIYVSRGTGYWGPPMRLGVPPEITHVTLESGSA